MMDEAVALDESGRALWNCGDLEAAQIVFERLLELALARKCPELLSAAWNNLAVIHRERGESARAAACQQRSCRATLDRVLDDSAAITPSTDLANLANDAILNGNLRLASRLLGAALGDDLRREDLADAAADLGNLGVVAALSGDLEQARNHWIQALRLHHQVNDDRGQGIDLQHLAELKIIAADWPSAAELISRSLFHLERAGCRDLARRARRTQREIASHRRLASFDPARN
jgi:tetratricopeptide (TPR) repeat protein